MRLRLVRHGQTGSNVLGLLDSGTPGPGLTSLGREQAAAVPAALDNRAVAGISASTMVRTQETAAPLAEACGLSVRVDSGLREIEAGDFEMRSDRDAVEAYLEVIWAWADDDLEPRIPGGQNGYEFLARFDQAVEAALGEASGNGGDLAVIFSHAAAIRVWTGNRSENLTSTFVAHTSLENTGSVLVERLDDGRWRMLEWTTDPMGGAHLGGASGPATFESTP